jgi:hypothetical protein
MFRNKSLDHVAIGSGTSLGVVALGASTGLATLVYGAKAQHQLEQSIAVYNRSLARHSLEIAYASRNSGAPS